jgi:hypothetical protein
MSSLLLIVTIAGERLALPATRIESVVQVEALAPFRAPPPISRGSPRCAAGC